MSSEKVMIVRIYCTESEHMLDAILNILHDQEQVAGVTAFRGIAGFGQSGKMHTASLLDISLDMPVIIEFFDHADKARRVMKHLESLVSPGHMVSWLAESNTNLEELKN